MSIQTTIHLTRKEAEERLLEDWLGNEERKRAIRMIIDTMGDQEVEDALESQFENFSINP